MAELGQLSAIKLGFLMSSQRPVGCLACPARFERAIYALEALKISRNNSFKVLVIGVAQHREPGVGWNSLAIGWHPQAARWLVV